MNKPNRADVRQVNVKVSGITFESVRLRHDLGSDDFDIVIDDPNLGRFALTPAVPSLELRDEDSEWRQVTLDELKKVLADDGDLAEAAEEPQAFEIAERESFNRRVAEGEHIMNAEIALFNAGIPFLQLPFQQNKFASNLFMVLNLPLARACLQRAGFQPKFDSETVLFGGCNGQAVQLLQGKYRLPRVSEWKRSIEQMKKTAAIYVRVSTPDQHVESQLYDLRELASQRGFEGGHEYLERGVCGKKARRPGLDALMADARRKEFSVVLVAAFDRIARSTRNFLQVIDELDSMGIEFISRRENVDTSGPMGRLFVTIISAIHVRIPTAQRNARNQLFIAEPRLNARYPCMPLPRQ